MTVLDVKSMLDVERFRNINILVTNPEEVYLGKNLRPESNLEFLRRSVRWIPIINFADFNTGHIYGRLEHGKWIWRDEQRFSFALNDQDTKAGLEAIASDSHLEAGKKPNLPDLRLEEAYTMGAWGNSL
jgi:hypothetical protein